MMQFRFSFARPLLLSAFGVLGVFALSCLGIAGCGDDLKPEGSGGAGRSPAGTGGTGTASSGSSSSGMGTAGSGSSSSGMGGTGGMGGAGGAMQSAQCGNGIVEGAELCDDANTQNNDYCAGDCSAVTGSCGDGVQQGNESCDDGQITMNCNTYGNGGDGKCVPAGTCSPGYFLSGNQCIAEVLSEHVHIMVDNFCNMSVMPLEYTVPAGQKLKLSYHNHSVDYPVDVWLQYGGGFLDLQQGMIWNDNYEHCFGPVASENYADITTACSSFKLKIHCL